MSAVTQTRRAASPLTLFQGGRAYLWLTLLALVAAALSLMYPSTPSYDPWSWLIWGREILHAITGTGPVADRALHIAGGSSWKPLPVIFTTVFALFGSAQANLWLIVARAGAALTVLMTVKLTVRVTYGLVTESGIGRRLLQDRSFSAHAVAAAPVALAGAAALVCSTFTKTYGINMMLGYSEGVMTAAFLIAAERAWDGHHRQAFVLGIVPCIDRPEVWPIWGLYGLWLMWRDRGSRLLVPGLGILMLALWAVPQKLGGGRGGILGLGSHALQNHQAGSAVNSSFPFWDELAYKLRPLLVGRLEGAALLLLLVAAYLLVRTRRERGSWRATRDARPATTAAFLCAAFGFLWWFGIALETQVGFAGNPRYAVLGSMYVCLSGCAAYGWACIGLAALADGALRRLGPRGRGLRGRGLRLGAGIGARSASGQLPALAAAATLIVLVVFARVPDAFTNGMPTVSSVGHVLRYQARIREQYASLVRQRGGAGTVMHCGSVMTSNYQVTELAWYLKVPIFYVQALPPSPRSGAGPNVVFQLGRGGGAGPTASQMRAWMTGWQQKNGTRYAIASAYPLTLYTDCSVYSKA